MRTIGLILLVAWLMRPLADLPLWVDEGWSAVAAQQDSWSETLDFVRSDVHPPLYFVLLRLWIGVAGKSVFAMRLPSFYAALLSVAIIYRVAREMMGEKTAWAAALILATSDLLFSLTPEVRHYVPYLFWASLSSWCLWRNWRWGYVLASLALIYTLYWGIFILLAQGVFLLLYRRPRWRNWLPLFLLIGVGYLPWLPSMLHQLFAVETNTVNSGGYSSAMPLSRFAAEVTLFQVFGVPEALFLGLSLAGLIVWEKGRQFSPASVLVGLWLFLPLGLAFASAGVGYSLLTHRPMVALLPPMAILAGFALSQMPNWAYQVLLGIIVVNNVTTTGAEPPARAPWYEMGDFLAHHTSPNETLLVEADLNSYAMQIHTELAEAPFQQVIRTRQQREGYANEPRAPLGDLLENTSSLWLIEYIRGADLRPDLAQWGYIPTTPSLKLTYFILDDILLTRFARPMPLPEDAPVFGELLTLGEANYFIWHDALEVNLTWYPRQTITENYTVSVFVLGENGAVLAQHDSYPLNGKNPTQGWEANLPYFDRHTLAGVAGQIGVKVYLWRAGEIEILPVDGADFIWLAPTSSKNAMPIGN